MLVNFSVIGAVGEESPVSGVSFTKDLIFLDFEGETDSKDMGKETGKSCLSCPFDMLTIRNF